VISPFGNAATSIGDRRKELGASCAPALFRTELLRYTRHSRWFGFNQPAASFGRWRQQLWLALAVKWLAGGASIQQVASNLGYESVPSFVTMFRKVLGTSPGRYMAERHSRQPR
jgi:AraC-like DNA-binding protein